MRVLALGWDIEGPGVVRAEFPSAESLTSYDAVLVDPEPLPALWQSQAVLSPDGMWRIYPGRDLGLARALQNLFAARRGESEDLLLRGGGVLVVRVRAPGEGVETAGNPPLRFDRYAFLPRASLVSGPHHLGLPQGLKLVPRRGRDIAVAAPGHPLASYLAAFASHGYEAVLVAALGSPLASFGQVLASNRVGDVVAWDLPVGTGRILFVPSFPGASPAEVGEHLLPALASLLAVPLPESLPDWLAGYSLPGEEDFREEEAGLARERDALGKKEDDLREKKRTLDALRGLLSPRGTVGLVQSVQAALAHLGFTSSPVEGSAATVHASSPEGDLLVRVALSLFGPVGPEEHRALLLDLDRLRAEEKGDARGVLVCLAEPRLDPRRRGPQWTDAVRRSSRDLRLTLTSSYDLFRAVRHALSGGSAEDVVKDLLSTEGEWRWKG